MLYSLEAARDNVRNREGKRVFYLGKGDQLTSAARDYLARERIEILPAQQAGARRYRLLGGGYMEEKPEHMTHLNGEVLVPKTHPRIHFRGSLDALEAELILCQLELPGIAPKLGEILGLARKIMACDVLEKPLEQQMLCGLTMQEQRERSHFPQNYYAVPHFMPGAEDGMVIARLNKLRSETRKVELAAAAAYSSEGEIVSRPDILQALNRMSSMLYLLMIEQKGEQYDAKNHSSGENIHI